MVVTLVMAVIRLVTNMMVDIMVTKMMVVISLVTNIMVVITRKVSLPLHFFPGEAVGCSQTRDVDNEP